MEIRQSHNDSKSVHSALRKTAELTDISDRLSDRNAEVAPIPEEAMNRVVFVLAALAGLSLGCQRIDAPAAVAVSVPIIPWFEEITEQVGLDFIHDAGPLGNYFMPQQIGSGAALFDFNKDGRLDIYLLQNGGPKSNSTNRLYEQTQDGSFRDVSKGSGLDIAGYNMGVAVGDINNDGWPDVLVTQYNDIKLFLNQGNGSFRDVTQEAGISNPSWGTSAAFFDYDRDGWLDLVIANYVDYDPTLTCIGPFGKPDFVHLRRFMDVSAACSIIGAAVLPGRVSRMLRNHLGWDGTPDPA